MYVKIFSFSIITIIVAFFYVSRKYQQIGPTCGFYALVYGVSRNKKINKKKIVKEMIQQAINNRDSEVGEIFDVDLYQKLANQYFPDQKISIVTINSIDEIDIALQENYVIVPYLSEDLHSKTPHYIFIDEYDEFQYRKWDTLYKNGKKWKGHSYYSINKFELLQQMKKLNDFSFDWNKFLQKDNRKIREIIFEYAVNIIQFFSDPQLYLFLMRTKKEKLTNLQNTKSDTNMACKVIVIKRTSV